MTPRSATSHKRTSGKASARKAPPRKASARSTSGKGTPRKATSGKASSGKATSGKASPRKATSHRAADEIRTARHRTQPGASRRRASAVHANPAKGSRPGTERARDEQRDEPTPRYGGGPWSVADERGDARFGHARNDDADPSELARRDAEAENDDDDSPAAADPELAAAEAAGEIESSGQRAGMHRGEQPRKNKSREP